MSKARVSAIVVALVLGRAGCGSTSRQPTAARVGHRAGATGRNRRDRQPASSGPPPAQAGTNAAVEDDEPHASRLQVSNARSVARAFFTTYVAFLYGRLPARRVADADQALHEQLEHADATTTPAERASRPRIAHLSLTAAGPPVSVIAVADVTTACCAPTQLTASLETNGRSWLVVAVTG
jgi:hypothetical protein